MSAQSRLAFTLVEIMIVVAIIGLLAAIAIPSFTKSRNEARKNSCLNNLRQLGSAKEQYVMANNVTDATEVTWANIRTYIKTEPICPSGGTSVADSYAIGTPVDTPTCLRVPAHVF